MQRDRFSAADVRLANVDIDLQVAAEIADRFPSRACFHAQQAAELVLKPALIALTDDHPHAHIAVVDGSDRTSGLRCSDTHRFGNESINLFMSIRGIATRAVESIRRKLYKRVTPYSGIEQARSVFEYAADLVKKLKEETALVK